MDYIHCESDYHVLKSKLEFVMTNNLLNSSSDISFLNFIEKLEGASYAYLYSSRVVLKIKTKPCDIFQKK